MDRMHRLGPPSDIGTPLLTPFYPVQKLKSGAIRFQSGLTACTALSTCLHNASFDRQPGAPANQVWEPIAPHWPSCTGLIPQGGRGYILDPLQTGVIRRKGSGV
jgi:hypothetical protein